jgi:hypothetical protein
MLGGRVGRQGVDCHLVGDGACRCDLFVCSPRSPVNVAIMKLITADENEFVGLNATLMALGARGGAAAVS